MFTIKYSKQANKTRAKMPKGIAERIDAELESIAADPAAYQGDWRPLQGSPSERGDRIRIISARLATKKRERLDYEENKE